MFVNFMNKILSLLVIRDLGHFNERFKVFLRYTNRDFTSTWHNMRKIKIYMQFMADSLMVNKKVR